MTKNEFIAQATIALLSQRLRDARASTEVLVGIAMDASDMAAVLDGTMPKEDGTGSEFDTDFAFDAG